MNGPRFGFAVLIGLSLLTAALADFFFYGHVIGWTMGGFFCLLLVFLLVRHGRAIVCGRHRSWGWSLSIMTSGSCVSLVLEPGAIAFLLSLIGLGSLAMLARGAWVSDGFGWGWLVRLAGLWFFSAIRPVLDSRIVSRWRHRASNLSSRVKGVAKLVWSVAGVLIPVALSLVFLGLFALANPIVADWMHRGIDKFHNFLSNITDYVSAIRILIWYFAAFGCWGLLRYRPCRSRIFFNVPYVLKPGNVAAVDHPVHRAAERKREEVGGASGPQSDQSQTQARSTDLLIWLTGQYQSLIVRCLLAMNAVFALQLVLDSRYLVFGGQLPEGMTYAQYAHRGAYPLIATAILAATMVLAVFRPGGIAERSTWARRLVLLWIGQNVALVASAVWRLAAYVDVYTLTRLRVAAAVWMFMVAGCLFLLLWRIARSRNNYWLTARAMGWGLIALWLCSFVPFDPLIARYNVHNCREMGGHAGSIDLAYLEALGPDALPAIDHLIAHLPAKVGNESPSFVPEPSDRGAWYEVDRVDHNARGNGRDNPPSLQDQILSLRGRLSAELTGQMEDWRGWTVRRAWLKSQAGE